MIFASQMPIDICDSKGPSSPTSANRLGAVPQTFAEAIA